MAAADGELSDFGHWLTLTHTQRWHAHYHDVGTGHLYQGRFKSFPVATDDHFLPLCRYVERNALRAGLVSSAADWRWGSLWRRQQPEAHWREMLAAWPAPEPVGWVEHVNEPQTEAELRACGVACSAVSRWGRRAGSRGWRGGWGWRARCARGADHQPSQTLRKGPDTFS